MGVGPWLPFEGSFGWRMYCGARAITETFSRPVGQIRIVEPRLNSLNYLGEWLQPNDVIASGVSDAVAQPRIHKNARQRLSSTPLFGPEYFS